MYVLGIETSCDETAAAVVKNGRRVVSSIISSQIETHAPYGGVVPELASRMHLDNILPVLEQTLAQAKDREGLELKDIDALAVTRAPGLMGALLVGLSFAKAVALCLDKPLVTVNHLKAHLGAAFIEPNRPGLPAVGLLVSGGHSNLYHIESFPECVDQLGQTLDDAAGEAFDKVGKLLGLAYPSGPIIERLADRGRPIYDFPRPMMDGSYNFSFSGLKTAVLNFSQTNDVQTPGRDLMPNQASLADVCASFQSAVIDVLTAKTVLAVERTGVKNVILAGGVAANKTLRRAMEQRLAALGAKLTAPDIHLCTDNGAMIAAAGYHEVMAGRIADPAVDAASRIKIAGR